MIPGTDPISDRESSNLCEDFSQLGLGPQKSVDPKDIARRLNETKRERARFIHDFIKPLKEELEKRGFNFDIYGRPKSIYSIYLMHYSNYFPDYSIL